VVDICKKEVVENDDEVDLKDKGVDCTGKGKATTVSYPPDNRRVVIATVTKTNIIRLVILLLAFVYVQHHHPNPL
jgi:hypothetical protein